MKLVVICPYPEGRAPSQRLKYEQYFRSWREFGFDVYVRPFWDQKAWERLYREGGSTAKAWDFVRGVFRRLRDYVFARTADLVYVHLEALPLGPPIMERALARRGVPLVYDIDDLIHLPHSSRSNSFMRWLRHKGKVPELIGLADEVIVCTPYLEQLARNYSTQVTDISSTIDTDTYVARTHSDAVTGVVVGWSGSHSTAPYLHLLDDVLRELHRSDDIRVTVIGDSDFSVPGVPTLAKRWNQESEVDDLLHFDIGVYPLPDEEWVLGKSGLKALQYMGVGVPVVAQEVGANLRIIDHGRNGFLANSHDEWVTQLRRLIRDPGLRRSIGAAGRATVEDEYSVRATAQQYLAILKRAAGLGPQAPAH